MTAIDFLVRLEIKTSIISKITLDPLGDLAPETVAERTQEVNTITAEGELDDMSELLRLVTTALVDYAKENNDGD